MWALLFMLWIQPAHFARTSSPHWKLFMQTQTIFVWLLREICRHYVSRVHRWWNTWLILNVVKQKWIYYFCLQVCTAFIKSTGVMGKTGDTASKSNHTSSFHCKHERDQRQELPSKAQRKQLHRRWSQGKNNLNVIKEEAFETNI